MSRGIYTLLMHLKCGRVIVTGGLGEVFYPAGYYAYTGSARGSGGFLRVQRHISVARGVNKTRHWHIDYLLPNTEVEMVVCVDTEEDVECLISDLIRMSTSSIERFGSTDCGCLGHLQYHECFDRLLACTLRAYFAYSNRVHLQVLK
jgi:endonuclease-3